jgi:hypothetical protein
MPGLILDQQAEGACCGFGSTQELLSSPVRVDLTRARLPEGWPTEPNEFARRVYHEAQKIDEWPGESPVYEGSSVLAAVKVLATLGLIRAYRWCFSREDLVDTLSMHGPVILGMTWKAGMYSAPEGILRPDGGTVGGHCILATGYDPAHPVLGEAVRLTNSWGSSWGDQGSAWVAIDGLWPLLEEVGEMAVPTARAFSAPKVRPSGPTLAGRIVAAVRGFAR